METHLLCHQVSSMNGQTSKIDLTVLPYSLAPDILLKVDYVTLKTRRGFIQGETVLYNNTPINVFKGVPFAKPPVGPLRFRKPEKVDKWKGIYYANSYKSPCAQSILRK